MMISSSSTDFQDYENLHEFARVAKQKLSIETWDYLMGGAETETTLRRNRLALDMLGFRPRVLRDVENIDCSGNILGHKFKLPLILAPIGEIYIFYNRHENVTFIIMIQIVLFIITKLV